MEKLTAEIKNLEIMGDSIESLPSLKHLTQCQNLLIVCPALSKLGTLPEQLKILKMKGGYTCPQELPDTLETLQISGVRSDEIGRLKLPKQLLNLDLSSNQLIALEEMDLGAPLSRLNLDHNNLSTLPQNLYHNKSLLHLSLDGNPLTDSEKDKLYKTFGIWF